MARPDSSSENRSSSRSECAPAISISSKALAEKKMKKIGGQGRRYSQSLNCKHIYWLARWPYGQTPDPCWPPEATVATKDNTWLWIIPINFYVTSKDQGNLEHLWVRQSLLHSMNTAAENFNRPMKQHIHWILVTYLKTDFKILLTCRDWNLPLLIRKQ